MATSSQESADSWAHKFIHFHIKATGLSGEHFLKKHLPKIHFIMCISVVIFICQEVFGVTVKLNKGEFDLEKIVIPLQYAVIFYADLLGTFYFTLNKPVSAKCVENTTVKLHCSSEENMMWRKYTPLFKFFVLTFVVAVYILALFTVVLSPFARFGLKLAQSSYVLYPVWYPVDVFSSSFYFWAAFVYEAVLFLWTVHIYTGFGSMILYCLVSTKVRLYALNQYLLNSMSVRASYAYALRFKADLEARDISSERLKKSMEDLNFLQRQTRMINSAFLVYFSSLHFVAATTNPIMAFAAMSVLQNAHELTMKTFAGCFVYVFFLGCGLMQIFTVSHIISSIEDAQNKLWFSLWENDWFTERKEFKKLFYNAKTMLSRVTKIKAYTFYPINLETFNTGLLNSWSLFLFLVHMSSPRPN